MCFDHLTMPCCPICDNAIEDWMPASVIQGGGAIALAHTDCVESEMDEDEDED